MHSCDHCGRVYSSKRALVRHVSNTHRTATTSSCAQCGKQFRRIDNLQRHQATCTGHMFQQGGSIYQRQPPIDFTINSSSSSSYSNNGNNSNNNTTRSFTPTQTTTSFKNAAVTYVTQINSPHLDLLQDAITALQPTLTQQRQTLGSIKFNVSIQVVFHKAVDLSVTTQPPVTLQSEIHTAYATTSLSQSLGDVYTQLVNFIDVFECNGSGWVFSYLNSLELNIYHLDPLRASVHVVLPKWIRDKKATINVKNTGNDCFQWAILAGMHHRNVARNNKTQRAQYRPFIGEYNLNGIEFPVPLADVKKFGVQNNMSINVFGVDSEEQVFYPLHVESTVIPDRHVDLLLYDNGGVNHWVTISNFNKLLGGQISNHQHRVFCCPQCLHAFSRADLLELHRKDCCHVQRTVIPENKTLYFTNIQKQLPAPFVVYADFESILTPVGDNVDTTCGVDALPADGWKSASETFQTHIACSFAYQIVSTVDPTYTKELVTYRGEDAAQKFLQLLQEEAEELQKNYIYTPKPMEPLTAEELGNFRTADTCHICEQLLGAARVKDHCHITGKYRGAAHNQCNLMYRIKSKEWKLPVFIHNLKGYDSHLIIKSLQKEHGSTWVIPQNKEKYLSFSVGNVRFLDSMQFMPQSLDSLVSTLHADEFKHVRKAYPLDEEFDLVSKKGVYPYDFMDSFQKFEVDHLPSRDEFFSKLYDAPITAEQYEHAQQVWDTFSCETMADYHDLYLECDVLLLADVFEKFRKMCLSNYGLDAAHYFTSPGLSFDAALRMTRVRLQVLPDIDMHHFVENSIRGGISMITTRYAEANHPHLSSGFDPMSRLAYLIYLDANNLYGWAMSQPLPTHGFRWLTADEIRVLNISHLSAVAEDGYILEVDIHYPPHLHDLHNDYPLAPETMDITSDMYSPLQTAMFPQTGPQRKLTPNLMNKTRYVVHYRNLQLYMELGLLVTAVHRVLTFKQSPWLKTYIDFNTEQRSLATDEFSGSFFKLMNNSFYGKTQENLRKRVNVELILDRRVFLKRIAKPTFYDSVRVREDLVVVQSKIVTLVLDRPIYVGFSVLDLSKLHMYRFHYLYMKKKYPAPNQLKLLFTDTDSLAYQVYTADLFRDMAEDAEEHFDFSEYPFTHPMYSIANRRKLGKFKDEFNSIYPEKFCGLRPKCYAFLVMGLVKKNIFIHYELIEKKTAKGTKATVKEMHLHFDHYKSSLDYMRIFVCGENHIRSHAHSIITEHVSKISLSPFDTKRWLLDDGISTLAYGHYLCGT